MRLLLLKYTEVLMNADPKFNAMDTVHDDTINQRRASSWESNSVTWSKTIKACLTAHWETPFLISALLPDLSLISHSSTSSTPIRTLAVRHCISKWNISKQICCTLLHLYSTEACSFFFLRFSLSILQEVWHSKCMILKSPIWHTSVGFCHWNTCICHAVGHYRGCLGQAEPESI